MSATEPTYYLFAGKLFHAVAFATEPGGAPPRSDEVGASAPRQPRRSEDPGPEGPLGEPVGEDEEDDGPQPPSEPRQTPPPGPGEGMPFVNHSPDANPIDPRVFTGGEQRKERTDGSE